MCDFIEGKIKIENKSDMFSSRHSELVLESPENKEETLKQVQGDKSLKNYF